MRVACLLWAFSGLSSGLLGQDQTAPYNAQEPHDTSSASGFYRVRADIDARIIGCNPGWNYKVDGQTWVADAQGEINFDGRNLLALNEREMQAIRGDDIAMIFQEPMTSLNPVYTVGEQIGETLRLHKKMSKDEAYDYAIKMLAKVGIPSPEQRVDEYPHQMSGGMKQRVMIAMALACDPKLVIADEPTTALDVTIQAQILDLLRTLQRERGMAVLLITHDLGVVAETAHRVCVMYAGRIVEEAPVAELFERPAHPYTRALLASMPSVEAPPGTRLEAIGGHVPEPAAWPDGCRFHPRCPERVDACATVAPAATRLGRTAVACHAREGTP